MEATDSISHKSDGTTSRSSDYVGASYLNRLLPLVVVVMPIMMVVARMLHPHDNLSLRRDWGDAAEENESEQDAFRVLSPAQSTVMVCNPHCLGNTDHFGEKMNTVMAIWQRNTGSAGIADAFKKGHSQSELCSSGGQGVRQIASLLDSNVSMSLWSTITWQQPLSLQPLAQLPRSIAEKAFCYQSDMSVR
jgi:hypothetical protein